MKKFLPTSTTLSVNKNGFTLVELMVVITIIAILTVIGITVYNGVQKNARDARRRADIDSIASAMEANYGKVTAGKYSALAGTMFSSNTVPEDPVNKTDSTSCSKNACYYCVREAAIDADLTINVCAIPEDRVSPDKPSGAKDFWVVCANLESSTTPYCRKNQQ